MSGHSGNILASWQEYDITVIRMNINDYYPPGSVLHEYANIGETGYPIADSAFWLGWTFTALSSYQLDNIRLKLGRGASDIGSPYVRIRNAIGDFPVGGDLAFASRPYTDLPISLGTWMGFLLSASVNLTIGNRYTIILSVLEAYDTGWERVLWPMDGVLPTDANGGVSIYTDDSGSSWEYGTNAGQIAAATYMFENWEYP